MFAQLWQKLFGKSAETAPPLVAPAVTVAKSASLESFISSTTVGMLNRQVVVNRDLQPVGYQFNLREGLERHRHPGSRKTERLYDEVLIRNFVANEAAHIGSNRLIFLPLSIWSADSPVLQALPAEQFVLMLRYDPEYFATEWRDAAPMHMLRNMGFKIGFDNFPLRADLMAELAFADFLRLSVSGKDLTELSYTLASMLDAAQESSIIASDIQFFEEMYACRQLQVHYLQGSYFRHQSLQVDEAIDANYLRLIDILNMVRREAELKEIAQALKCDPILVFKLLRHVNSAGAGLSSKVDSIERALIVLGHQKIYRWLTLLLFTHHEQAFNQAMLLENALIRARLLELLGTKRFAPAKLEQLFTIGMLSLLEALLRLPMVKILARLNLPDAINATLLGEDNEFQPFYRLALAVEGGDMPSDDQLLKACGLSRIDVNRAQLEAMLWAQSVT